jgi:uncharacterized protein (TIGR02118 family)
LPRAFLNELDQQLRGSERMYSMIFAVYPKAGMSAEECQKYIVNVHSKIGERIPNAKRLRQFAVTGTHEVRDTDIAAFTLLEFDSQDDFSAAAASTVMEEANADVANFAEHIGVYTVVSYDVV